MRLVLKWVLCAIIGVGIGFLLMIISEPIFTLLPSVIVAFLAGVIIYAILENCNFKLLISIAVFIILGFAYFALTTFLEEVGTNSIVLAVIYFILQMTPIILMTFAIISHYEEQNNKNNNK